MSERCVIALDLGGTTLKAGLVGETGETLHAVQRPSRREEGPDAVVAGLCAVAEELAAGADPAAIGLVVPGVVDEANGIAVYSANFGWRDLPLRARLETVASARAIAERYGASAAEVAERCAAGEPPARAVWQRAVDALADALAMYVSILAPELIVVGGGLSEAGDQLLRPLDAALSERLTFHRRPRLRRAALGDQAGRLGAALLAWELAA